MSKQKATTLLKRLCIVCAIIGVILIFMGFYKKDAYNNPDNEYTFSDDYINTYVGGDAYNYIINGTYFTAYAVLGTGFLVISSIFGSSSIVLSIKNEEKEEDSLPEI